MDHPTRRLDPNAPHGPGHDAAQALDSCPRCSGRRVWAKTLAHAHALLIMKQDAGMFGHTHECVPLVCTTCGYTEFYTADPQKLTE